MTKTLLLSQALSHPVPVVVQIPTYLLSALNIFVVLSRKGQDLGWGTVTWVKPPLPGPISASRFPTELELEHVLQRLAAGLWGQFLCFQTYKGIDPCPDQLFSGPLARASLCLTKVMSALVPISNHRGYCSTTSPDGQPQPPQEWPHQGRGQCRIIQPL